MTTECSFSQKPDTRDHMLFEGFVQFQKCSTSTYLYCVLPRSGLASASPSSKCPFWMPFCCEPISTLHMASLPHLRQFRERASFRGSGNSILLKRTVTLATRICTEQLAAESASWSLPSIGVMISNHFPLTTGS